MKEFYNCVKCGWSMSFSMNFGVSIENSPPCPRCLGIVEGFRIIDRKRNG